MGRRRCSGRRCPATAAPARSGRSPAWRQTRRRADSPTRAGGAPPFAHRSGAGAQIGESSTREEGGSRDQSHVVTRMRGTPGYMAPEWLTSQITEKADVYSFGVVVMEIICRRKNLDYSQPEGSIQLISLLQEKAKNGKLEDMIERNSLDILMHKEEAIEMMNLAIWCLQSDSSRRPAMSLVVKVMEGERQVESNLEYNFFDLSALTAVPVGEAIFSTLPVASSLSSPR